jgi:C4-dicarboxylate-specific signal transduction histidine kinase
MTTEMRKTGVDVVGDMPWGTHFCLFYDTKADLLDTLVSYCRAGLQSDEFCMWVVAPPVTVDDAIEALRQAVPDFDRYLADGSIEIVSARDWYLADGKFDLGRVMRGWLDKVARASARGYAGVRVTGDTVWLEKNDWTDFVEYEKELNVATANQRMTLLCTYRLDACGADEILDVVRTHQFAVTKRRGSWEVIETAGYKQAKEEIKRLNDDLERRVEERTSELTSVNLQLTAEALERQRAEETLRQARADLAHVTRVTTMGELAASLAHEIKQPITAAVTDAHACLRWLERDQPNLTEARQSAAMLVKDATRASDIINRIRLVIKRGAPEMESVDVNEIIQEMIELLRHEATRHSISIRSVLADDLPRIMADRVQLQQVLMNLMLNGIEAMTDLGTMGRLTITSERGDDRQLVISVRDTGAGVSPEHTEQLFRAFFTTKPQGTGMGLSVSRSIVELHGGRLWASTNAGGGAAFWFTLPIGATPQKAEHRLHAARPGIVVGI